MLEREMEDLPALVGSREIRSERIARNPKDEPPREFRDHLEASWRRRFAERRLPFRCFAFWN